MRAVVLVRLKEEVVDAPGRVVAKRLVDLGYGEVKEVRLGKLIELEVESADAAGEEGRIKRMCSDLLANERVEEFEIISIEE